MAAPGIANEQAEGIWSMTIPWGELLFFSLVVPGLKPASVIAYSASSKVIPVRSGTSIYSERSSSLGVDLIVNSIVLRFSGGMISSGLGNWNWSSLSSKERFVLSFTFMLLIM